MKEKFKMSELPNRIYILWILILQCQCQFYSILTVFKVYIEQNLGSAKVQWKHAL